MQNLNLRGLLLGCTKSIHPRLNDSLSRTSSNNALFSLLLLLLPNSSSSSSSSVLSNNGRFSASKRRGFCGYAAEQFSDDEYECDFENHTASSSVANIDEWKWKLSMLLRNETEQEIVSRDKRDRRDYEQISNLARRMGLYSEIYGRVVVASKVPLPNYRPDLDDKRPQREVVIPLNTKSLSLIRTGAP
ncbi:DExH-box ATP-dependent RNA helicase DExH3-like [Carica papaya]|uniref:DExH-box ATP-dependent RNA helicase DExH3-like n=1 Tax=Carica papaya TaxID=3649 RepID=UPI000B8CC77A|nr:DExH-box ATP-dependent RNA helicase DExH3-like [Carica papaya]